MKEFQEEEGQIVIYGAREHNLKNIDLTIPRNSLTVITKHNSNAKRCLCFLFINSLPSFLHIQSDLTFIKLTIQLFRIIIYMRIVFKSNSLFSEYSAINSVSQVTQGE